MKELDKKNWVNTADVVEFLKSDPDSEHEISRYLGGMLRSTYWMEYKSERICLRFREIGFAPTTTPKRSFSSAMRGIGGISPVRRGHDGIRPFVRSNPKKLDTFGQMLKFFCKRSQKNLPRPPGTFLGLHN